MQNQVCLECATCGISQSITPQGRCACCGLVGGPTTEPREFWETRDAFVLRAMATQRDLEAALVESAPEAEEVAPAPVKAAKKARCPHYAVIKEFAAIARENGLSMADKDRARGAMGVYLGIRINSRADLTEAQWNNAITGLRAGLLFW